MQLATELDCGLVAMCSCSVKATEAVDLGDQLEVPVIALDVIDHGYGLPKFSTDQLLERTRFVRSSDTAKKRNMGLLLSRSVGWERVLFLDDDIHIVNPASIRAAAGLLNEFDGIGMHNSGYPDNSVVCHANRLLGAGQKQFIGAGAMIVTPNRGRSFFPDVYNDDWFFMLGLGWPARLAITGEMMQRAYDPFANPNRARTEELGDCLAEGLYWLLDHRLPIGSADIEHWRDFLIRRSYFVDHLIAEARKCEWNEDVRDRVVASLNAARSTSAEISPRLCTEYIARWQTDLETWRSFVRRQPVHLGMEQALVALNWPDVFTSSLPWRSRNVVSAADEDRLISQDGWMAPAMGPEIAGAAGRSWDASQYSLPLARKRAAS